MLYIFFAWFLALQFNSEILNQSLFAYHYAIIFLTKGSKSTQQKCFICSTCNGLFTMKEPHYITLTRKYIVTRDVQEKNKIKVRWGRREFSNIINVLWCFFKEYSKKSFLVRMSQNLRKGAKQVAAENTQKLFPIKH